MQGAGDGERANDIKRAMKRERKGTETHRDRDYVCLSLLSSALCSQTPLPVHRTSFALLSFIFSLSLEFLSFVPIFPFFKSNNQELQEISGEAERSVMKVGEVHWECS